MILVSQLTNVYYTGAFLRTLQYPWIPSFIVTVKGTQPSWTFSITIFRACASILVSY